MKSLYKRQFMLMAGVILISFALLGGAFVTLSYQYAVQEKRDSLGDNAKYIAQSFMRSLSTASTTLGQQNDYAVNIDTLAKVSDSYVIVTETDGLIFYSSDGSDGSNLAGGVVPSYMVSQVAATGSYSGMTDLGGIFPEKRFVAGTPILVQTIDFKTGQGLVVQDKLFGMVFVAAETASLTEMWRAFASIFFFTSIVVLLIAFITSSVTSLRQTKPLKEMAEAARKFGHGEFDVRVSGSCERCDEVGELATAFNAMADSLAKSEARRSEFVANISHELKTPMTTIAGFADGILDGTVPPEKQEAALKTISSETRRLSRLVRRMLDLSRLQSAEHVTAQEQFDVSEIMLRVLVSLEGKINSRHLDVDTQLPEEPVKVWGIRTLSRRCATICWITPSSSPPRERPWASAWRPKGERPTSRCAMWVRPSLREELPLVFDRFHKTDHSRSEDREGVGLGLYIVKTILDNHKENISVTSENGVTEFTFTLTLA